jgi:hypothetical protein
LKGHQSQENKLETKGKIPGKNCIFELKGKSQENWKFFKLK